MPLSYMARAKHDFEPEMEGELPFVKDEQLYVIARADVRRPDLRWPFPERMAERLTGARVTRMGRRSKYILADLDRGEMLAIVPLLVLIIVIGVAPSWLLNMIDATMRALQF